MEPTSQEPVMAEAEMKMPEQTLGENTADALKQTSRLGVILGMLIVFLILLLGGLYLWGASMQESSIDIDYGTHRPTIEQNNEPESATADAHAQALETVSTSNEIEAIEADIESTHIQGIDQEIEVIDAELDATLENI